MLKKLLIVTVVVAATSVGLSGTASAQRVDEPQVTICHATNSATNPYVELTVDQSAVDGEGNGNADHYGHTGPIATSEEVAQALKDQKIDWGDIIPPVPGFHAGLNWTAEGQAMLANGCNPVDPENPNNPGTPGRGGDTPVTTSSSTTPTSADPAKVTSLPSTFGEQPVAVIATISVASIVLMVAGIAAKAAYVKFF